MEGVPDLGSDPAAAAPQLRTWAGLSVLWGRASLSETFLQFRHHLSRAELRVRGMVQVAQVWRVLVLGGP